MIFGLTIYLNFILDTYQTFLSHMTAYIDYDTEYKKLSSSNIYPAYDGLKIEIWYI